MQVGDPGISIRRRAPLSESPVDESLHAERASTSAGRFHLRIVELEARAFERVRESRTGRDHSGRW